MKMIYVTPPATITTSILHTNLWSRVSKQPSLFGSVLARVVCSQPQPEFDYSFTPPRYPTTYLQHVNAILIQSDGVIEGGLAYCEVMSRALCECWFFDANRLIPATKASSMTSSTAKALGLLPSETYRPQPRPVGCYKVIPLVNAAGEVWIKDRTIAALYKTTLQTITRLTRGKR